MRPEEEWPGSYLKHDMHEVMGGTPLRSSHSYDDVSGRTASRSPAPVHEGERTADAAPLHWERER